MKPKLNKEPCKNKVKRKRNMQDATLKNVRAAARRNVQVVKWLEDLTGEVVGLQGFAFGLIDILKSKRLLTPAQCKMLEDCLK